MPDVKFRVVGERGADYTQTACQECNYTNPDNGAAYWHTAETGHVTVSLDYNVKRYRPAREDE